MKDMAWLRAGVDFCPDIYLFKELRQIQPNIRNSSGGFAEPEE
jgi:hypothetical protein